MIKINLKNNKGVTLIGLSVTVLIMLIIAGTLIYNSAIGNSNRSLTNMYNDIELLQGKVSAYYVEYGKLPVLSVKYPYTENIQGINVNDNDNYYVIDLSLLSNLTLNYGKGYQDIKNSSNFNSDVYVINEQSHNIYYPTGIEYDNIRYYTISSTYSEVTTNSYDRPYIPQGCVYKEGTWNTGFVIKQTGTDNEFVWIPVKNYDEFINDTEYKVSDCSDTANGYAISMEHYNKMLESVKNNGGFYIGRYESGIVQARTAKGNISADATITENVYPYNFVTRTQAQILTENIIIENRTTSLMYGVQWDAVLRFITEYKSSYSVTVDAGGSTDWGNYANSEFSFNNIAKVKYTTNGTSWQQTQNSKTASNACVLTTCSSAQNSLLNICDIAGNVSEYTLEQHSDEAAKVVVRGGNATNNGISTAAETRVGVPDSNSVYTIGFRAAMW